MEKLQQHIDGLKKLVAEGFCLGDFRMTVHLKRGDEDVEFIIQPENKWTAGAGVVAANRNCYHHGKDPHEAYHEHAKDKAKKKGKGKKHKEAATDLIKLLDGLAKRTKKILAASGNPWQGSNTKEVNAKGWTVWIIRADPQYWHYNLRAVHNPTTNKFKFDCHAMGQIKKSDKSWVIPMTFLEKLGANPDIAKIIADPSIVEGQ
jgi:hypothetical protein